VQYAEQYDEIFKGLCLTFNGIKEEKIKQKGLSILRKHLKQYYA
jgi:hypothetical protein